MLPHTSPHISSEWDESSLLDVQFSILLITVRTFHQVQLTSQNHIVTYSKERTAILIHWDHRPGFLPRQSSQVDSTRQTRGIRSRGWGESLCLSKMYVQISFTITLGTEDDGRLWEPAVLERLREGGYLKPLASKFNGTFLNFLPMAIWDLKSI